MTSTIFSEKKAKLLVCLNFLLLRGCLMFLYLYLDIMCICCRNVWECLFFHEVIWTLKQRYQITHVLCCIYSVIVQQEHLNHICWKMLVYFNILSAHTLHTVLQYDKIRVASSHRELL